MDEVEAGADDDARGQARRAEFCNGLESVSGRTVKKGIDVEKFTAAWASVFEAAKPRDALRRRLFEAAVGVAQKLTKETIRVNKPFASALARATTTGITFVLQWPRKYSKHVEEMSVEEFARTGLDGEAVDAHWLSAMSVQDKEGNWRRCMTGDVLGRITADLLTSDAGDEVAYDPADDSTIEGRPVTWVDSCEFAPGTDDDEYKPQRGKRKKPRLAPPPMFKDAVTASASAFVQMLKTMEGSDLKRSELFFVCGGDTVSALLGALESACNTLDVFKASEKSLAAYGLSKSALSLTKASGLFVVRRARDGHLTFIATLPALQNLSAGSCDRWKQFATGMSTMFALVKALAGRTSWNERDVAERAKGVVSTLASIAGKKGAKLSYPSRVLKAANKANEAIGKPEVTSLDDLSPEARAEAKEVVREKKRNEGKLAYPARILKAANKANKALDKPKVTSVDDLSPEARTAAKEVVQKECSNAGKKGRKKRAKKREANFEKFKACWESKAQDVLDAARESAKTKKGASTSTLNVAAFRLAFRTITGNSPGCQKYALQFLAWCAEQQKLAKQAS